MFVVGLVGDRVYEYQLGTPFTSEDRSASGNDGVGKGGVTPAVGRLGQAIRFDGVDDHIDVGAVSGGVRTIAFWLKAATTTADMNIIAIDGTDRIELDGSSNVVASGFPSATVHVDGSSASAHIADTGWHHVVITDTTGVNAADFDIGRVEGAGLFGGTLDDVRLYDRVLSADEIKRLHGLGATTRINRTLTANPELEDGLVGHWTFDGQHVTPSADDVSTASFVDGFSVAAQDTDPWGLTFNADGTKMFIVGAAGDGVYEYTLTTGFDVSTASFVDSFSVAAQDTNPRELAFSGDGTTMFVVGSSGASVYQYTLTTGFDVSTASFVDSFSIAAQETFATGLAFNTDGTTMFVVGLSGDSVYQYALSTGFDVSTASFVDSFSVAAQETFPTGLAFSSDGTTMFVVGLGGTSVYQYRLTTGFDVSTAAFVDSVSVAAQEAYPTDLAFSADGTKMFVVGRSGDSVHEYQLGTSLAVEDRSANQNRGVSSGGVTPAVGRLGQAIRFDGIDDYIDVGAVSGGVQTIAFWLKAATTTADMNIIAIDGTDRIELDGSSNVVASGFPSATVHVDGSSASAHIADTGWHHVVITDTSGVNAADFDIGRVEGAGLFGGTLDDVRLYDRVLSADEIKRLHGLGATTRVNRTIATDPDRKDGLVGHWTFDGPDMNNGVEDRSGERNTGTLSGYSATTTRPGVLGQALAFDGVDDYVSIPHISTPDELTYSFWINISSSDTQNPLLSMRTLVRIIGGNQIQYFPDIDTTVVTASGLSLLDEWHHIAVTHDSSNNYVIYVDGVSELSGTTVDIDSGVVAGLGSRFGGYNSPGFVDGSMDDVRIYNRALSADEIKRLHAPGS